MTIIETWINYMEELETFWDSKIQKLSQKCKFDSNSEAKEFSSSKLIAKKKKVLNQLENKKLFSFS
jgi:hypothetical protein